MESVSFVSAKMKEMSKEELKAHRKRLMEDAMKEAKKSIARKEKEGAWMLPDLDSNMFGEEKSKKRKKSSKEKKHKKEQKTEEHTSELQSHHDLVCRLLLEKKKKQNKNI